MASVGSKPRSWWIWVALVAPYIALLWLPFYNDRQPALVGFPFFYWYQFAWVPLTSLLLYLVYRRVR
ncbi:MAG: DUF3311 domain-containing protein [Pseudomonadota bacterium]